MSHFTITAHYVCPKCGNDYFYKPTGKPPKLRCCACLHKFPMSEARRPLDASRTKAKP